MGIRNLKTIIPEECVKKRQFSEFFGLWVAIDASMLLYQSLIGLGRGTDAFTDGSNNSTAHLVGLFYRSIRLLELGIKPVFVFDGTPPDMKAGELEKRQERKEAAEQLLQESIDAGDAEAAAKAAKRTIRLTTEQMDDAKTLLRHMGIPVVEAKGEAEAQCAQMCKDGLVSAVATEDMDALTFGCPRMLRHFLSAGRNKNVPIREYRVDSVLDAMELTMDQFVDVCILCGCDYTETIPGIGPKKALDGIREALCIEDMLLNLTDRQLAQFQPELFQYKEARRLFMTPDVTPSDKIKPLTLGKPKRTEVIKFLCDEKQFDRERVLSGLKKLQASKSKTGQTRLDCFFKASPSPKSIKTPLPTQKGSPKRAGKGTPTKRRPG
ncbi:Flap endonuclease FEN1 [Carpediemonas membranifera]|uniref:Flap endonuclease 1 n=1 Tax=Carpediemonas membranifera TaxID=201153 RepID=A0A8J6AY55_9EUKA|nr:Flap endonuclease FEN1 [Carpediemonas membranifera]|eukprot:KAG9390124.1 Flap endonuclease FEN1 [Carpediemonas membranifera]